ncbi:MAG: hypothetical protein MR392_09630, partial [Roseburia sp.]|nr:hypothetical protein [Roseburia sp.]
NILAIIANTIFVSFIRRYFQLKKIWQPVIILIVLMPHIMTPIASATNMILTNSLLSEGISFSLYPFFIMYLLKAIRSGKILGKDAIYALVWGVFLSLIRGQMMSLLIVWLIVMSILAIVRHGAKNIILIVLLLGVTFTGRTLLVKTYNYAEQGLWVNTVSGQAMAVSNVIYVSDRDSGDAIEDEELRNLFYRIFDAAYADKMNYQFAGEGIIARAQYHEECHDAINFDYFSVYAKDYISETRGIYVTDYQRMMVELDQVAAELMKQLLPQVFGRYVWNYLAMIAMGFIRTVAYVQPVLNWYTIVVYLTAVLLTIVLWYRKRDSYAAPFMAVVLLMIVGNVTATSLMLQCVSRYMLYNFPLFYIAGITLLIEYVDYSRKVTDRKEKTNGL